MQGARVVMMGKGVTNRSFPKLPKAKASGSILVTIAFGQFGQLGQVPGEAKVRLTGTGVASLEAVAKPV